jgi:hypothetical protein
MINTAFLPAITPTFEKGNEAPKAAAKVIIPVGKDKRGFCNFVWLMVGILSVTLPQSLPQIVMSEEAKL